jgi:hypothetical protein
MKRLLIIAVLFCLTSNFTLPQKIGDSYIIDINNIKLPIDNKGILANVNMPPAGWGGKFDSITVLWSGGFFLSGFNDDSLWANGVAPEQLIEDYLAGTVYSGSGDPRAQLYKLNVWDEDFGISWLDWVDAVALGADFYDGDGDGIYHPVDKNSNGVWDPDEDAPDMIRDQTVWCVFNDGVASEQRRWGSEPQGIEIYQTIFLDGTSQSPRGNIIYVRYRILNSGTVVSVLDSVYFAVSADPDLGIPGDDLTGCDTLIQTGFTYNDSSDSRFGDNPPALAITLLQGPNTYIPGETFVDVNSNGVYDDGIDKPITTAYNNRGQLLGIDSLLGAKNLEMTSFMHSVCGSPELCRPLSVLAARYRMLGMDNLGNFIDPCIYGEVHGGVDCTGVNPLFMYSGDPLTDIGWILTHDSEQKMIISTGPFQLEEGKPVDIILAYSVGRGTDALNSVTETKSICQYARSVYENNFDIETSVNEKADNLTPDNFYLSQNYPNPFNSTTSIKYQIPELSFVKLKIFNLLGEEVKTMVNNENPAGSYEVNFDAANLPSGIYFYRLQAGDYIETKKMVLMK